MAGISEGLRIPSVVLVAVGVLIVIMLLVIVFGIVAFIFRRNSQEKHGPRISAIQECQDGEERVYEEPDSPPQVPQSERPLIRQMSADEQTTGRPGNLEFSSIPLMYRGAGQEEHKIPCELHSLNILQARKYPGAGQEEHKIPCDLHSLDILQAGKYGGAGQEEHKIPCELLSLDIMQARKNLLIAYNKMLSAQPEHESLPGYFKMNSPPRLPPSPDHFLGSGIKGTCATEEGPVIDEYMAMALQEGCLAENCTNWHSSDTQAGDLPEENCEIAHQITVG